MSNQILFGKKRINCNSSFVLKKAEEFIKDINPEDFEANIRKKLIPFADSLNPGEYISFDGNTIVPVNKILKHTKRLIENYGADKCSDLLYNFLTNDCGTTAHYNKEGWFSHYSTLNDLKELMKGVRDYTNWKTDSNEAITGIRKLLNLDS